MKSENEVQQQVRQLATKAGILIMRNNVGAGVLANGSFMRWGLANESAKQNKLIKSADLIGIKPVTITADMVGKIIGQFVSIETKKEGWVFNDLNKDQFAQNTWRELINNHGGLAIFSTGDISEIMK